MKVIQLNTQHKKTCTALLAHELSNQMYSVALLQEPYLQPQTRKIPGLNSEWSQYHSDDLNSKSAILIHQSTNHFAFRNLISDYIVPVLVNGTAFISVYQNKNDKNQSILLDLHKVCQEVSKVTKKIVISADTNGHSCLLFYDKSDKLAQQWEEFILQKNYTLVNDTTSVTFRNTRDQTSAIDWTLISQDLDGQLQNWRSHDHWDLLSDHQPITFELIEQTNPCLDGQKNKRKWKKADWTELQKRIEPRLAKLSKKSIENETELNFFAEDLTEIFKEAVEKIVPRTKYVRRKNFWWTKELQKQKSELKKQKRKKSAELSEIRKNFEKEIYAAKQRSWKTFLETSKGADDSFLRYKILCKPRNKDELEPVRKSDDKYTTTLSETAEELLRKNFPDLNNELSPLQQRIEEKVNIFLERQSTVQPQLQTRISIQEIRSAIQSFSPSKQPGIDGLPAIFLQKLESTVTPILEKLFNSSLNLGIFPQSWKHGLVIFLKKPGKQKCDPSGYRPITLLPIIAKTMEKVMKKRLNFLSKTNQWVSNSQLGFQEGMGAEDGALKLSNHIISGFKKKQDSLVIFLDITGAFNDLWHSGFLFNLLLKKCPPNIMLWFRSYLTGRTAQHRETGVQKILTKSTPQGAVLSPLIWNIFFNSIIRLLEKNGFNVQCFADDSCVVVQGKDTKIMEKDMNHCLKLVHHWAQTYKITFNSTKTKAMHFTWSSKRKRNEIKFFMNNSQIELVDSYKYLGIYFDRKLSWKVHLAEIAKRATNLIYSLKRGISSKWGISGTSFKFIYENAIRPVILYGALTWGSALKIQANKKILERVQRLAMLSITGCLRTTSNLALQIITGLPPIHLIVQERMLTHMGRITINGEVAEDRLMHDTTISLHQRTTSHTSSIELAHQWYNFDLIPRRRKPLIDPTEVLALNVRSVECSKNIPIPPDDPPNKLFTDGSKKDSFSPVGFSVVDYTAKNDEPEIWKYSLPPEVSVFRAELLAILKAVEIISKKPGLEHYGIYSDSKSSLLTLENPFSDDPTAIQIQNLIKKGQLNILFAYVRGHQSIEGNELADVSAKEAINDQKAEKVNWTTPPNIKEFAKNRTSLLWKEMFNNSITAPWTRRFFTDNNKENQEKLGIMRSLCSNRKEETLLYRSLSGHIPTNSYLYRFNIKDVPKCKYCDAVETIDHVLYECSRFMYERYKFTQNQQIHPHGSFNNTELNIKILNLRFSKNY